MSDSEDDQPLTARGVSVVCAVQYQGLAHEISQQKAAEKMAAAVAKGEVIEISDDEDEDVLLTRRRPRSTTSNRTRSEVDSRSKMDPKADDVLCSEDDELLAKHPRRTTSTAPISRSESTAATAVDGSDDDGDISLSQRRPAKAGAGKAASTAGQAAVSSQRSEDSDDDGDIPLSQRRPAKAGAGKAASTAGQAAVDSQSSDDDDAAAVGMAVRVAQQVLSRGSSGDHEGVLSALGVPLTRSSPFEALRKAYRGLARLIHPDKLAHQFSGATRAFQALARAFEVLTAPAVELPAQPTRRGQTSGTAPAVGRSNEGCYRTRVCCPRCGASWGGRDSGLQPYEYTFLMQALKTYFCAGCLFEFGCMSGTHKCPHCRADFAYEPSLYHQQVECQVCGRSFGFMHYTAGPRVQAQLAEQLREQHAKRMAERGSDASRQQRRAAVEVEMSAAEKHQQAEVLFTIGLLDACPRCGASGRAEMESARRQHLRRCTDASAHSAHLHSAGEQQARAAAAASARATQGEASSLAAWQFLGGQAGGAWMLTDGNLDTRCAALGLPTGGERIDRLARLAAHDRSSQSPSLLVGDGGALSSAHVPPARAAEQAEAFRSLPANLHALGLSQLQELCAGLGMALPEGGGGTEELVALLEARRGTDDAAFAP